MVGTNNIIHYNYQWLINSQIINQIIIVSHVKMFIGLAYDSIKIFLRLFLTLKSVGKLANNAFWYFGNQQYIMTFLWNSKVKLSENLKYKGVTPFF